MMIVILLDVTVKGSTSYRTEPCAVWLLLSRQAVPSAFITEMAGPVVSVNYTPFVIKTPLLVDLDRRTTCSFIRLTSCKEKNRKPCLGTEITRKIIKKNFPWNFRFFPSIFDFSHRAVIID